jgi:hypothetical protein
MEGVDDWDKAASFVDNATPRRSTSSLDDDMSQVDRWVVHVAVAALLVHFVATFLTTRSLIGRLRSDHRALWINLGSPDALMSLLSRGTGSIQALEGSGSSLGAWLSARSYIGLNDPTLATLGRRREVLKRIGIGIVIALVAYGLLRYSGVLAFPGTSV